MSLFLLIFLLFSNSSYINGLDVPVSRISDDSLLRTKLKDTWLTDTPNSVLSRRPSIEYLESGERIEVSAIEGREEFMVILSRELMNGNVEVDNNPAYPRGETGRFPGWAQGSWTLTRRKDTGAGVLVRIFLRSDQFTYFQFRPFNGDKCQMDVVLYGAYIIRSMPVAVNFDRIYTMQLNEVLRLLEDKFPRRYFEPDPFYYRDNRRLISQIRQNLAGLRFSDDGAIDENGNYVYIENLQRQSPASAGLNCSGFVKWLVDGILRPVTGARLPVSPLKQPHGERGSSFTANWEDRRDPYFGLDWIRNLAARANETLRSASYSSLDEFEVRSDIFSLIMVNENRNLVTNSYPGFLPEAGYGVEGLYPLLYTLAVDDPYTFYLAAVNNEIGSAITNDNPRGGPRLRQYYHVAALVPYFDEYGIFRIAVFESAAETSFNAFRSRYPGHYINLVKIPIVNTFNP